MTKDGNGDCVPVEVPSPVCTLSASPTSIPQGGSSKLTWTTQNADSASLNQGIGSVPLNTDLSVSPNVTTTYTLTATGHGKTVNCHATVTVTSIPQELAPVCTLSANPTTINKGDSSNLSWTTNRAHTVSINQGIGGVALDGNRIVSPNVTTTYTLTAIGNGGQVTCATTITVVPPNQPEPPVCQLTISPSSIVRGGSATLTWSTSRATSVSIDQGIGGVNATGNRSVSPNQTTTYTLTATGNGQTVTCPATITVTDTPSAPACFLSVTPSEIDEGDSATIRWGGTNITSVSINEGIGSVGASGSRSVSPREGRYTYTGTFKATNGETLTCSDTLRVEDDNGGGGSTKRKPRASLDALPTIGDQPFSFVYLNDLPYTGVEMSPLETMMYWFLLIGTSAVLAYFLVFSATPFVLRKVQAFGGSVKESINEHDDHAAPIAHSVATLPSYGPAAVASKYSSYEGFRSFAQDGALTIDDIVTGLARETHAPVAQSHVVQEVSVPAAAPVAQPAVESFMLADDIPGFIKALLAGDKDAAFSSIRNVTKRGDSAEEFLTHAVCALDDAYRSKIDGTQVHPEIAALTNDCHPSFLEKVVGQLSAAVDGTYSTGVTGVKLAVTRALGVVNG